MLIRNPLHKGPWLCWEGFCLLLEREAARRTLLWDGKDTEVYEGTRGRPQGHGTTGGKFLLLIVIIGRVHEVLANVQFLFSCPLRVLYLETLFGFWILVHNGNPGQAQS